MFKSKAEFKEEFSKRLAEKYGKNVKDSHISERYDILGELVRDYAGNYWRQTREYVLKNKEKQLIYFSMEFLIGKLLHSNMMNLGIYEIAEQGLKELGIDIRDLENEEHDAGLGNGGLGRLAACFMDSLASLGYAGHGNCIRYEYGFFRQAIRNNKQIEMPDHWLSNGYVFEVRKPKHAVEVKFYGNAETYLKKNGQFGIRTANAVSVKAMPYDVSLVGYRNNVANTLRLWSAEPSLENLPKNQDFEAYLITLKELCHGLYPDDSTEQGRILRLRQQYFLVSAGLQSAMRGHFRRFGTLDNFADYHVFQLNDTHPILAIPEMMRLLIDEYEYEWEEAWRQVQKSFAYTNHTVMAEALEKWPIQYVQRLLPRCFMIIEEISRRFNIEMAEKNVDYGSRYAMQIIKDGQIHMTNLAIHAAYSVNGVAKLHTEILKRDTFRDFYELYPQKFNNKTNGVTHRRWLMYANPELAELITSKIGEGWKKDFSLIKNFEQYQDDKKVQDAIIRIKHDNKVAFASYMKKKQNVDLNVDSIFDVQIKRLHAYKRQLMNIFHIIYLYQRLKEDPSFKIYPRTFVFGAKAAPSYDYAKKIIELILAVADIVDRDSHVSKFIKVLFVENYGVSSAEKIIPASDISEQISTAGKEASGTGNMKFMMNGAITLGTLDGANVEIADFVGLDNCIIFGLKAEEVEGYYERGDYNPWDIYNSDERVKKVIDSLFNGPWTFGKDEKYQLIFDEIMHRNDSYFILKDFAAYVEAQEKSEKLYLDRHSWARMQIINIANSGFFTSDRTIEQYVQDIWHLKKLKI
ncbi:MAG: glycogen/starch/alpha-glucan phosphorylase [Bacilli bacterium]|jgi:starch phosphorylase|nr:glycogen/starch/alpha-glucan phosphorylase [Bacilli bacterium]